MLEHWIIWVWYATPVLQAMLLGKLLHARIAAKYPWFFAWMCLGLLQSLVLITVASQPKVYQLAWIATLALAGVLEVGVAREVFSLRSRQYGGVSAFGRGLLAVIIVIAIALALFAVRAELRAPGLAGIVKTTTILKRTVDSSLALFLLTAGAVFLFFHETPVSRNVLRHFRILVAYFTAVAAGFLVGNLTGRGGYTWVNLWFGLVSAVCYTLWTLAFSTQGETAAKLTPATPEERARLARLDAQLSELLSSVKF
jgi:hypothetical protein